MECSWPVGLNQPGVGGGADVNAQIAGPADSAGITNTLVEAFFMDPVWSWVFSDPILRRTQFGMWFRLVVGGAIEHHSVGMTPAYEAVSVWIPPGCPELSEADGEQLGRMLEETMGKRAELVKEVFACFETSHPHDRGHYYLSLLGTHTDHRGSGIG